MLRCRHSLTSEGGRVGCSGGNVSVATAAATEGNENDENKDDYYDESDHNYDGKVHTERRDCCYRRSDESTLGTVLNRRRDVCIFMNCTCMHTCSIYMYLYSMYVHSQDVAHRGLGQVPYWITTQLNMARYTTAWVIILTFS